MVIGDLLKFAKPCHPVLREISVMELIESIRYIVDSNTLIKGININYFLADTGHKILADAEQIRQVILNIVQNAIEAMTGTQEPCMKIITGWDNNTDEVYITISNNGEPIPAENLAKLGNPFFTTKEKGTGLGLSISYHIIRQHHGHITVDSGEDRETSFTIYLPCCKSCRENNEPAVMAGKGLAM